MTILAAQIQTGQPQHVVLSGPSGSGKTTLARIYAQSAMCEAPLLGGSPCGHCSSCGLFVRSANHNFHAVNCGLDGAIDTMRYLIDDAMAVAPMYGRRHVVFFDEAHRLSLASREALLAPLEEERRDVLFVFSLIDPQALPFPLLTRCRALHLETPTLSERISYLGKIAENEGLNWADEALTLLAGQTRSLRELAARAESLSQAYGLDVDVSEVRELLLAQGVGAVFGYVQAALAGHLDRQLEQLAAGAQPASAKYAIIRDVLLHLKLRYLTPLTAPEIEVPYEGLFDGAECAELVAQLSERAAWLGTTDIELFDSILEFWSFWPEQISDAELKTQAVRLHDRLAFGSADNAAGSKTVDFKDGPARPAAAQQLAKLRELPPPRLRIARPQAWALPRGAAEYISGAQAAEIFEAATFMVQRYGLAFNARLEIDHGKLRLGDDRSSIALISRLARELGQSLKEWIATEEDQGEASLLHRITVHERPSADGLVSTMIMHLPKALEARVEAWVSERFLPRHLGVGSLPAGAVTFEFEGHRKEVGKAAGHWNLVRRVLRGLDPTLELGGKKLTELLEIPVRSLRPAGVVPDNRRFAIGRSISRGQQGVSAARLGAHGSAWRAQAWQYLTSGWEFKVHQERFAQEAEYQRTLTTIAHDLSKVTDSLTQQNLMALRARTTIDRHKTIINQRYLWTR